MSRPPDDSRRPEWLGIVALLAALCWAAALVADYYRLRLYLPDGPRMVVFLAGIITKLKLGFEIGSAPFPALPLLGGVIALLVFHGLGKAFLGCFDIYMPRWTERAVTLLCGMCLAGLLLEPLAIFGALYTPVVWVELILAWLILARIGRRRGRRAVAAAAGAQDAIVYRRALRAEGRKRYRATLLRPRGVMGKLFFLAAGLLVTSITILTFWHGLLLPPDYWDSLILYLGYARMTFLEHAFHVKVTAQVGIGLGANYPHLFALLGAATATMWNHWSPVYQQLLGPLFGLCTTLLIYQTVLRLTRHVNIALSAALLYRAIPYGIAYNCWTSDYAMMMALAAAAAYVGLLYIETGLGGYLAALTLLTAAATHVNYLGWLYWGFWGLVVVCAHAPSGAEPFQPPLAYPDEPNEPVMREEPEFAERLPRPAWRQTLRSRALWTTLAIGLALSSTWYIRNWIVTGNPVYAFFPEIFKGTKNFNPEVLDSAVLEWKANGDGIGVVARQIYGANSLLLRLRATGYYFVRWRNFTKFAPIFVAFFIPGILFWLAGFVRRTAVGGVRPVGQVGQVGPVRRVRRFDDPTKFGLAIFGLWLAHILYFYLLGDFYLYQIIAILPLSAMFIAYWPLGVSWRVSKALFGALVLCVGAIPGLPSSLMGPKLPENLEGLRHPLMREDAFYRQAVGAEYLVISYINQNLQGEKILTHENRHLLFDPSIQLVHLDDWDIQPLYDVASPRERAERLKALGIHYYLRMPGEFKHPVNQRLGLDALINEGLLDKVFEARDEQDEGAALYRLR